MDGIAVKTTYAPARPKGANYTTTTDYEGTELRRPPGVDHARFRAFELPSRMGNYLYYPNGDVKCVETP